MTTPLQTPEFTPSSNKPSGVLSLQTIPMPADTNWSGDVFGGWLVSQMDLACAVAARFHAKSRIVTVSINNVIFHRPVKVGSTLACYTKLLKVGNTSMQILVEVWEVHDDQQMLKVTDGIFTFVAIDEHGNKRAVPPLVS